MIIFIKFESDLFRNKILFSKNTIKSREPISHVFRVFRPQEEKIRFIFILGLEKQEAFNKTFSRRNYIIRRTHA